MIKRVWQWLRSDRVVWSTPDVRRVFIACRHCGRVQPHYRVYAPPGSGETGQCRSCGRSEYTPRKIATWRAAWWLFVVGYGWRKTIRREARWDPRMPIRRLEDAHGA